MSVSVGALQYTVGRYIFLKHFISIFECKYDLCTASVTPVTHFLYFPCIGASMYCILPEHATVRISVTCVLHYRMQSGVIWEMGA